MLFLEQNSLLFHSDELLLKLLSLSFPARVTCDHFVNSAIAHGGGDAAREKSRAYSLTSFRNTIKQSSS